MSDQCCWLVWRGMWPDTCQRAAKVYGTLTMRDREPTRIGLCAGHARRAKERGEAQVRSAEVEPRYPYVATGTWEAEGEAK